MKFNKYVVASKLSKEGIGRKKILEDIFKRRLFKSQDDIHGFKKNLDKEKIEVIACNQKEYPKYLKEISDYPLVLFVKGDINLLSRPMITMVGTRKMSVYGKRCVRYLLKSLKGLDIVIVSGLANGVDEQVHRSCLEYNISTLAVVAGGIDKGYPKSNQDIYDEICSRGVVLSEFPPGREIVKGMFPMRNRILAGISSATVIIESDIRGGSLITMNLALEYGREIFAVPISIERQSLQGCNMCIAQGATPLFLQEQLYNFCKKIERDS
jgi:DNA processing protein